MKWKCEFTGFETYFLPFGILDHSLMFVMLKDMSKRKVSFKYFDFWANYP